MKIITTIFIIIIIVLGGGYLLRNKEIPVLSGIGMSVETNLFNKTASPVESDTDTLSEEAPESDLEEQDDYLTGLTAQLNSQADSLDETSAESFATYYETSKQDYETEKEGATPGEIAVVNLNLEALELSKKYKDGEITREEFISQNIATYNTAF